MVYIGALYNLVLFYSSGECKDGDQKINFPPSLIGVNCHECDNGSFLSYNIELKIFECLKCPKNTYSIGGNFRVTGSYFEWTNDKLAEFKSECFIESESLDELDCSPMKSINNQYIQSGNLRNYYEIIDYTYVSQFSKVFKLIKPGNLKFTYKKDTKNYSGHPNGIFRFLVNYKIEISDIDLNSDYKEVSLSFQPGTYSFMWQYFKTVSFPDQEMALTIESISLDGIDTAANECIPCKIGGSEMGSDHCDICSNGQYFDQTLNKCQDCPKDTYLSNNKCVSFPVCTKNDYKKVYSNNCNQRTRKMPFKYELANSLCKEENPPRDGEIDCGECSDGQYLKKNNNDYFQCEYCPTNTYSEGNNLLNCRKCRNQPVRLSYYYPHNSSYFENLDIETIDDGGHLRVYYELIDLNKKGSIDAVIDSIHSKGILIGKASFPVSKGKHSIQITANNANIKQIKVTHTVNGGGYKCNICNVNFQENGSILEDNKNESMCMGCLPGYEYVFPNQCLKCPKNYYKQTIGNTECKKCPQLFTSNANHTNCEPYQVANQNSHMLKINIGKLKEQQSKLCTLTGSLCIMNFYGPIRDNQHNMFFISYFSANKFESLDLTYRFESKQSELPSFIYMLKNTNIKATNPSQPTAKIAYSLGKEIDYIKFLKGKSSRGLIAHYINGDICKENPTKSYESYLFLKCDKGNEEYISSLNPRYITRSECKYYFEWPSKEACPICRKNEVSVLETKCKKSKRQIIYSEGKNCIFSNTTKESGDNMTIIDQRLIIDYLDVDIINKFELSDFEVEEEVGKNINLEFIISEQITETCSFLSNFGFKSNYIFILIPIIYLIIILILLVILFKYKKIQGHYHILVETPDSRNISDEKFHQQIELITIPSVDANPNVDIYTEEQKDKEVKLDQ